MKQQTLERNTGIIAITSSLMIAVCFILLGKIFNYPAIIREPPEVFLESLYQYRSIVPYVNYIGVVLGGVAIIITSVLLRLIIDPESRMALPALGQVFGVLSGLLLYIGIIRYTFLFPFLDESKILGTYQEEMIDLLYQSFQTYVGLSVAEHVQFTFTSLMLLTYSTAIYKTRALHRINAYFVFSQQSFYCSATLSRSVFPAPSF